MWTDWFLAHPGPVLWVILGTTAMYLTMLLLARLTGVRSFAQMSAFDVASTIAIGSLLATTIASRDPPLLQGMTAIVCLYLLQLAVSWLRHRWDGVRRAVDNGPILLMGPGGTLLRKNMAVARVTEDDLRCQLRKHNVVDPARVQAVIMEGTGNVHVLHGHERAVTTDHWILHNVRDYSGSKLTRNHDRSLR